MSDISYYGVEPTAARETETRVSATTVAGQTVIPAVYTVGFVNVFYNGTKLSPTEYTATDGANIVLPSAAPAGVKIDVISHRQVVTYPGNIEATPIGQANPAPGTFTSLTSTGTTSVPTKPRFDDSTSIATTEFVNNVGLQYSNIFSISSSGVALNSSHAGGLIVFTSPLTGAVTSTLPSAVSCAFPGSSISMANYTANAAVTVSRTGTDFIQASSVNTASFVLNPGETITLVSNGNNGWHAVSGSAQNNSYMTAFRATSPNTGAAGQSIPTGGVATKVLYTVVAQDDLQEYNTSTSTFTATYAGTYIFNAGLYSGGIGGYVRGLELWKNGAVLTRLSEEGTSSSTPFNMYGIYGGSGPVKIAAGDAITVSTYIQSASSSVSVINYPGLHYFSGIRVK